MNRLTIASSLPLLLENNLTITFLSASRHLGLSGFCVMSTAHFNYFLFYNVLFCFSIISTVSFCQSSLHSLLYKVELKHTVTPMNQQGEKIGISSQTPHYSQFLASLIDSVTILHLSDYHGAF